MRIKNVAKQGLFFFCLAAWHSLIGLPSGGEVIQGHVALIPFSKTLQINANGKAILNWETFNIASHEAVRFIQSQGNQGILNRVISDSTSEILGSLQANCPIYLVNPNGVFIGSSASIDTAGFLASTADLSNEAFWQGSEILFQEFGNGRIVNLGKIHVSQGDVYLIARAGVDNQGTIEAPNGIALLTTREMMLYPDTKECVFIRVSDAAEEGIQNSGTIQALEVELSTASLYEKAIQHRGSIEAFATVEQKGRIYLIAEESSAIANGSLLAESGEIRVLGQTVILEEGALIDVSGEQGGGTVLVGGDYQGANPDILNAQKTFVAKETQIHADADLQGNGGKVIIWSDKITSYAGSITACGGSLDGDGGLVEVSGKRLQFQGKVNTAAPFGNTGTLLLDPTDVTISNADSGGSFSGCVMGTNTFTPDAAATDTIAATTLVGLLNACNVTISTLGSTGSGTGVITVDSPITVDSMGNPWSAATTLTLIASYIINVNAAITNTSAMTDFRAMDFTAIGGGSNNNSGITLNANLTTVAGDVFLDGTSAPVSNGGHGIFFSGGGISTGSGTISIKGTVPVGVTLASRSGVQISTINGITSSSGDIILSGINNSTGTGASGVALSATLNTGTSGTVTFSNCIAGSGSTSYGLLLGASFSSGGNVEFNNCVGGIGGGYGIRVAAPFTTDGNVTATDNIKGQGTFGGYASTSTFSATGDGHSISITATATGTSGVGIFLPIGSIISTEGGSITLNGTGAPGSTDAGILMSSVASEVSTVTGDIQLTGTAGIGTASAIVISDGAFVAAKTSGNITVNATGDISLLAGNSGSAIMTTANGDILMNSTGPVIVSGSTALNSFAQIAVGTSTNIVTVLSDGISMTGGSGVNAFAEIATVGGQITIDSTGPLSLTGGSNTNTPAQIITKENVSGGILIGQNTPPPALFLQGGSGGAALIATDRGGDITCILAGDYTLTGGSSAVDGRAGFYTGLTSGSGNISLAGEGFALTGGASGTGYNNAEIMTSVSGSGSIVLTYGAHSFQLQGGAGSISNARIAIANSGDISIVGNSDFSLLGGSGVNALAEIATVDGQITIDGTGSISLTGGSNTNTPAQIITKENVSGGILIGQNTPPPTLSLQGGSVSAALIATDRGGDITCTLAGDYTLTGGSSAGDGRAGFYTGLTSGSGNISLAGEGFILTGGASGTGYNSAEITTPVSGTGSIALTYGANFFQLQGGAGSISNARIMAANSGDISIVGNSDFSLLGGSGADSLAEINAEGNLMIDSGAGAILLTGGSGAFSQARCIAIGTVDVAGTDSILTAGRSSAIDGSNAVIASTGLDSALHFVANSGSSILLNGSGNPDQHSYIQTTGATGTNPISMTCGFFTAKGRLVHGASRASMEVQTVSGDIEIAALEDVILQGGIANGTNALIQSLSQGALVLDATNFYTRILAASKQGRSGMLTQRGDISLTCSQNAQCLALTQGISTAIQTFDGDLTVTAGGSIDLFGVCTFSTPAPTGNLLLLAGLNLFIDDSAQIIANGINSSLTLVVDNNFPTAPDIGSGRFILDLEGAISAGIETPVRIYTARRLQNVTIPGVSLNGTPYSSSPFGVNTPTEQWGVYYPGGTYSGAAFTIYYKES